MMASAVHRHSVVSSRRGGARLGSRARAPRAAKRASVARAAFEVGEGPRLPRSPREQAKQAAEAVARAAASGKKFFSIEFSLPLIGATDLDDWPGGVRQQCAHPPRASSSSSSLFLLLV
jgi:hypothetical protein|eukprot:31532-Pelagococcus_subviridis.AAC.19